MRTKFHIGLLASLIVMAFAMVDNFPQLLTKKMQQFKERSPQVKLFLFFNQTLYMPGDTAYFSIRFLSEDMIPVGGRQVVRLELLDHDGQLAYYQNVTVKDGVGMNQVVLPARLKAGAYQWVAYSDWMKNFDEQFYFKQNFVVVEKNDLALAKGDDNLAMIFYPEGGSLVSSVSNKMVAQSNTLISVARIVDDNRNEVASISFDRNGLAQFAITPQFGSRYYAETEFQGKLQRFMLPSSLQDGLAMNLSIDQASAKLVVNVPRGSKFRSESLWMVVSARSDIYFTAPLKFENKDVLSMNIPLKDLPPGVCYATILNERGEVIAERLFAATAASDVKVSIQKGATSFDTRSNVNLQVHLSDEWQNPMAGEFAISVVNKKFLSQLTPPVSIKDYLLINSELATNPLSSATTEEELDIFLITQENKRINWKEVWQEKFDHKHTFKWMIEYSGKAIDEQTKQPVPDSSLVVVYLQKTLMGYEAVTRKDGSFDLPFILDFWNEDDIFYEVQNKRGREVLAEVSWQIDLSARKKSPLLLTETESINSYASFQMQNRLINQSFGFYETGSASLPELSSNDPNYNFEDELSGADATINVNEYVVFPSMEELIREVIPHLQHRKVKGKSTVKVLLPNVGAAPDGPLYIIDGIMTRDTEYFLKFKPSDIISIKIVKTYSKLMQMGPMAKNGIVLVNTKGLNHDALKRTNNMLPVKGINRPIPFHVIDHSKLTTERIPDFRSTLYWNPTVKLDARGEAQINFPASDDVGTFIVYIQGMTADGRPFEKVDSISVVFNKN